MNLIELFKLRMQYTPDLENPKTFSEKMLIRKLYDRRDILVTLTDKLESKNWVDGKTEAIPIPTLFTGLSYDPQKFPFVIKPNNYSGQTYIVENYGQWISVKDKMMSIRGVPFGQDKGAWAYKMIKQKFIIEPVIEDFVELKFFCFDGKCEVIRLIGDRNDFKTALQPDGARSHFWKTGEFIDVKQQHHPIGPTKIPEHIDWQKMMAIAGELSKGIDSVRIDLYWTPNQIYYGEHTFYTASGHNLWTPQSFDRTLGDFWTVPKF